MMKKDLPRKRKKQFKKKDIASYIAIKYFFNADFKMILKSKRQVFNEAVRQVSKMDGISINEREFINNKAVDAVLENTLNKEMPILAKELYLLAKKDTEKRLKSIL